MAKYCRLIQGTREQSERMRDRFLSRYIFIQNCHLSTEDGCCFLVIQLAEVFFCTFKTKINNRLIEAHKWSICRHSINWIVYNL